MARIISAEAYAALVRYLATRPYQEVFQIIQALTSAKEVEEVEEVPSIVDSGDDSN